MTKNNILKLDIGQFIIFQAEKNITDKDIKDCTYNGQTSHKLLLNMMIMEGSFCSVKDVNTNQVRQGIVGERVIIFLPENFSTRVINGYDIIKGQVYMLKRMERSYGILNQTIGERDFFDNYSNSRKPGAIQQPNLAPQSAPQPQYTQQQSQPTQQSVNEQEPFDMPLTNDEAVKKGVEAFENEKDKKIVYRAISARVEERALKCIGYGVRSAEEPILQAVLGLMIFLGISDINKGLNAKGKPCVEYTPAFELEEIEQEEEQMKENVKKELKENK